MNLWTRVDRTSLLLALLQWALGSDIRTMFPIMLLGLHSCWIVTLILYFDKCLTSLHVEHHILQNAPADDHQHTEAAHLWFIFCIILLPGLCFDYCVNNAISYFLELLAFASVLALAWLTCVDVYACVFVMCVHVFLHVCMLCVCIGVWNCVLKHVCVIMHVSVCVFIHICVFVRGCTS